MEPLPDTNNRQNNKRLTSVVPATGQVWEMHDMVVTIFRSSEFLYSQLLDWYEFREACLEKILIS